jgi:hypothetical protein
VVGIIGAGRKVAITSLGLAAKNSFGEAGEPQCAAL